LTLSDGNGGQAYKVSGPTIPTADVVGFGWSPDRSKLWFCANRDDAARYDLYVVASDPGGVPLNVSHAGPDAPPGSVFGGNGYYEPSWSSDGTRLAFLADVDPGSPFLEFQLYVVDVSTAAPAPVRVSTAAQATGNVRGGFAWSPDGAHLAFLRDLVPLARQELWIAAGDGTGAVQVSQPLANVTQDEASGYAWAPDGSRLAFVYDPEGTKRRSLWTCLADGSGVVERSALPAGGREVAGFAWAPDASAIAYTADQDADEVFALVRTAPGAGAPQELVPAAGAVDVVGFAWSPDATRLAFRRSDAASNTADLLVVPAGGGMPVALEPPIGASDFVELGFGWSPDGQRLAYVVYRNTNQASELHLARADGSGATTVGTPVAQDQVGVYRWSPDGARLAFTRAAGFTPANVFVVPAAGTPETKITDIPNVSNQPNAAYDLAWTPDGRRLYYTSGADALIGDPPARRLWLLVAPFDGAPVDVTGEASGGRSCYRFALEHPAT
jgi:Tol biopolymer transport system component